MQRPSYCRAVRCGDLGEDQLQAFQAIEHRLSGRHERQ
jgi:hypothetical protein